MHSQCKNSNFIWTSKFHDNYCHLTNQALKYNDITGGINNYITYALIGVSWSPSIFVLTKIYYFYCGTMHHTEILENVPCLDLAAYYHMYIT